MGLRFYLHIFHSPFANFCIPFSVFNHCFTNNNCVHKSYQQKKTPWLLRRWNAEKRLIQTYLLYMHPSSLGKGGVYVDFIAEFWIKTCVLIIFLIKSEHLTCFLLSWRKSEVVIQVQIWGMTTSVDFQNIKAVLQPWRFCGIKLSLRAASALIGCSSLQHSAEHSAFVKASQKLILTLSSLFSRPLNSYWSGIEHCRDPLNNFWHLDRSSGVHSRYSRFLSVK